MSASRSPATGGTPIAPVVILGLTKNVTAVPVSDAPRVDESKRRRVNLGLTKNVNSAHHHATDGVILGLTKNVTVAVLSQLATTPVLSYLPLSQTV